MSKFFEYLKRTKSLEEIRNELELALKWYLREVDALSVYEDQRGSLEKGEALKELRTMNRKNKDRLRLEITGYIEEQISNLPGIELVLPKPRIHYFSLQLESNQKRRLHVRRNWLNGGERGSGTIITKNTYEYFWMDEMILAFMIAKKKGIQPISNPQFYYTLVHEARDHPFLCEFCDSIHETNPNLPLLLSLAYSHAVAHAVSKGFVLAEMRRQCNEVGIYEELRRKIREVKDLLIPLYLLEGWRREDTIKKIQQIDQKRIFSERWLNYLYTLYSTNTVNLKEWFSPRSDCVLAPLLEYELDKQNKQCCRDESLQEMNRIMRRIERTQETLPPIKINYEHWADWLLRKLDYLTTFL